jgi:large-conductance mechanosensitive channel
MSESQPTVSKPLDQKTDNELKREAKARLKRLDPIMAASLVGDTASKSANGFVAFIRERAVVGLAIGFVIGTQMQVVVKAMIDGFITPLFELVTPGKDDLVTREWTVHAGTQIGHFKWGALVYALLNFVFIILVIYVVMRLFRLDKLDKKPQ